MYLIFGFVFYFCFHFDLFYDYDFFFFVKKERTKMTLIKTGKNYSPVIIITNYLPLAPYRGI